MMKFPVKQNYRRLFFFLLLVAVLSGCSNKQLQSPTAFTATADSEGIILSWEPSAEASAYRIYRKAEASTDFGFVTDVTEARYVDKDIEPGRYYQYKLLALSEYNSSEGVVSDSVKTLAVPEENESDQSVVNTQSIGIPALMYHEFVVQEDLERGGAFDEYAIWRSEFEEDLIWLAQKGYTTITTDQLIAYIEGTGELPEKPVLLTIDDGKLGVYKHAWPLLQQYGMTATLAVIGEEIDLASENPDGRVDSIAPYCTWDELKEMSESKAIEVVSHTNSLHVYQHDGREGANCSEDDDFDSFFEAVRMDYSVINKKLIDTTGRLTRTMAYPYSKRSLLSDEVWRACGYQILLSGDQTTDRPTALNYYVKGSGITAQSSVVRRIARMTGIPAAEYIMDMLENDANLQR